MNSFWLALAFLTRLPVPPRLDPTPLAMGKSLLYYPVVGAIIGLLLTLAHAPMATHPHAAAAVLVTLWAGLTGALHLDGLADSADAWIGGQGNRDRSLAIMKDPRSGPVGVVAVVAVILLKYSALTELPPDFFTNQLIWIPLLARSALLFWLLTMPYLRDQGLGSSMMNNMPRKAVILTLLLTGALALPNLDSFLLLLTVTTCLLLRQLSLSRFGGCTGDTLGASLEILEAQMLIGTVLLS